MHLLAQQSKTPSHARPASAETGTTAGPILSGAQLALAFDGTLEPSRISVFYHIALFLVFCAMVLLPVVYFAIIAAAIMGVRWYAVHASVLLSALRFGSGMVLVGVIYIAPLVAGGLLVLFMILPLFWRSRKEEKPFAADRREQALLYAYIDRLCDAMRTPRPARIDLTASPNASAHIDNGLFGLVSRRLVLTIGLPLVRAMDLRQFTGVMAHELGHFSQGGGMRLSYVVHRINLWFLRLAYGRSGIDDVLDRMLQGEVHWGAALIGLLTKLVLWITRLILMGMALISHALSMHLSRQSEYDADHRAARIVGADCFGDALQLMPYISAAGSLGLRQAQEGWKRHTLPDDLVTLTDAFRSHLSPQIKDKITASILAQEESWFDTHPSLFKRVAVLKKSKIKGVLKLDAPATVLFKDFDELCKLATIKLYLTALGENLQPEHLVPVHLAPAGATKASKA
ncbi:MAG TPA: M48 family metalloprotease [Phycisphaerae bacterium]|nr:M48 family metalloprotease [Phycisphaerae bacterium]